MGTRILYFALCVGLMVLPCPIFSQTIPSLFASISSCQITRFELSDPYLPAWGDEVVVHTEADCGDDTPRITLTGNDEVIVQADTNYLWFPIRTVHYPFGAFVICVSATSENTISGDMLARMCHTVWLVD